MIGVSSAVKIKPAASTLKIKNSTVMMKAGNSSETLIWRHAAEYRSLYMRQSVTWDRQSEL
jgi:hypothetical protein